MAQFRYSIPQRVFIYDSYVRTESARVVQRLFQNRFPDVQVPSRSSIHRLINKFRETGSVLDKKRTQPRTLLTEETVDNIRLALENSPNKSLRRLSQQIGISYSSVRTATKLLKLKPYKITVVQEQGRMKGGSSNITLADVAAGSKAPRKITSTPSCSHSNAGPSESNKGGSGGNPVCPRETPPWQKEITTFFKATAKPAKEEGENSSKEPEKDSSGEGTSGGS